MAASMSMAWADHGEDGGLGPLTSYDRLYATQRLVMTGAVAGGTVSSQAWTGHIVDHRCDWMGDGGGGGGGTHSELPRAWIAQPEPVNRLWVGCDIEPLESSAHHRGDWMGNESGGSEGPCREGQGRFLCCDAGPGFALVEEGGRMAAQLHSANRFNRDVAAREGERDGGAAGRSRGWPAPGLGPRLDSPWTRGTWASESL